MADDSDIQSALTNLAQAEKVNILDELDHLVRLPFAIRRLRHKQNSVRESRIVKLSFGQLSVKRIYERVDVRW